MKYLIRSIISVLAVLVSQQSNGQVTYSPRVKHTFDSVFNKLDVRLQKMVNSPDNKLRGIVLLTGFSLDTLNKSDRKETAAVIITHADTAQAVGYTPEKVLTPDVMVGRAKTRKDTIIISISPWFRSGEEIKQKIFGDNLLATYELWPKEAEQYEANDLSPDTDNLIVKASAGITLSERNFAPGKTIYGSGELVTDEYSQLYAPDFKNNTVRLRMKYSYVFKLIPFKDDGL